MTKPESFSYISDFPSLKNDGKTTLTVTLPGSSVIAGGATLSLTATATLGTAGATERTQIYSSKLVYYWVGPALEIAREGSYAGVLGTYYTTAELYRSSATQVTALVYIANTSGSTLTTEAGDETFTFDVASFIAPFE